MLKKAIILVAGMGTRLKPLTDRTHKCLTEVNGTSILQNALTILADSGINETVLVTGYLKDQIKAHIGDHLKEMRINYSVNEKYGCTNTSYSLLKGIEVIGNADELFVLEGDVYFEEAIFVNLCHCDEADNITVVEVYHPLLDGTFVDMDPAGYITDWIHKSQREQGFNPQNKYKTVNIHKFSMSFVRTVLLPMLEDSLSINNGTEPLENIMMRIVRNNQKLIRGMETGKNKWVEIDDVKDLKYAEELFAFSQM